MLAFSRSHFLLRSTRYAIASSPATANIASKPGVGEGEGVGVGVGVGEGEGVPGSVGVGVNIGVGVGEGDGGTFSPKSTKVVK